MATRTSRPGRTLVVFALIVVAMFGAAAAIGNWKPRLGLDLQGGERIVLQAAGEGGAAIPKDKLTEASDIIASRVNGAGVAESDVSTQGSDIIVVEIPGKPDDQLRRSLAATAQLRFRLVAQQIGPLAPVTPPSSGATGSPTTGATTQPPATSGATQVPSTPGTSSATTGPKTTTAPTPSPDSQSAPTRATTAKTAGQNRAAAPWLLEDNSTAPSTAPSTQASGGGGTTAPSTTPTTQGGGQTTTPTTTPTTAVPTVPSQPAPTTSTGAPPTALVPPQLEDIPDPYAWIASFKGASAPTIWLQRLAAYDCTPDASQPGQVDIPSQPLLACDEQQNRYLLGPSMLDGTSVNDASAGIPQGQFDYAVDVSFDGAGGKTFGDITTRIAKNSTDAQLAGSQLAIVLDGKVLSAPVNEGPITGGSAEISGSSTNPFTQTQAQSLANSLKYGALPLSFSIVQDTTEGPQLASNQLNAGILAGIVGLILVVLYCMLYYRGLGLVVVASLVVAGVITYASVLLLGHAYGFTLTLPGIAGLIVAVGITADSFIVYFERLRDEVRDGRTLRTSVETGWVRARSTILAADAVSMLAAVVLFVFAIGVVKGFAFALGLTTFIDVFVVFFFTKPVVTLLSRTKFFGQGHKWSGLDRQHLGMPALTRTPRAARGEA